MRLPAETFDIPAAEIRRGYRSAIYFNRAKQIAGVDPVRSTHSALMQVFQKNDAVLCGMDEAIAVLRVGTGRWKDPIKAAGMFDTYMQAKLATRRADSNVRHRAMRTLMHLEDELDYEWESEFKDLTVTALNDGDLISPWETVMHINGRYSTFAHLESVYLGVLARRTLVATNTRRVVEAANGKPILFFADRYDPWTTQGGDGYAAHIGGATAHASDAMGAWWGPPGMGTMPHALIAFHDGDVVAASDAFLQEFPDVDLIPLVDFNNSCVTDSVRLVRAFGDRLKGVRLDTSENLVDEWFMTDPKRMGDFKPTGVNPQLVCAVRDALDQNDGTHVKIVVSGGFNPDKITAFEAADVPVDSYAVGESLLKGSNSFTADLVWPTSKHGRWNRSNDRLERVE